ncbi:MAG: hypothetical protein QY323_02045 [Patescibacteria group bacterium]|nr:MAG: hypothetical protein QY323_02045 [Patescibacteria group bacterium]
MLRSRGRAIAMLLTCVLATAGLFLWYRVSSVRSENVAFGVTFSSLHAQELGLDWKETYLATLDDLGVRRLRIPVYWNAVEREQGVRDWSDVEWMLEEAAKRDAHVILAVGRKTPRWPECHVPAWAAELSPEAQNERLLEFLEAEIMRFKEASAVKRWQVENEPLFRFGLCPPPDPEILKREVALVRSLDGRPVMMTDSGELSSWLRVGPLGDVLGISMYRLVWNEDLGSLYWPVAPAFYADRIRALDPFVGDVIVSELQAEPWFHRPVAEVPIDEQLEQMHPEKLIANAEFAAASGASEVYLWGVEWWYWLSRQARPELWETAKRLFE